MPSLPRNLSFLACALLSGPAFAAEPQEADPNAYVQAFGETCRRGFPDLDAIARHATAHGWVERSMRPIGGAKLPANLPRAFGKGPVMLFLTTPEAGELQAVCQIAGTAGTRLSGRDIAALLTPTLNAGEPALGPGKPKENDYALWTLSPGFTVQAGISVYQRKARSISIAVRQAR